MPPLLRVVLLLCLVSALTAAPAAATVSETRAPTSVQSLEARLLAEVNALRRQHGRAPLRASAPLAAAAAGHSRAMATRGFFSHSSADGTSFSDRIARHYRPRGYRVWSVGENLAFSSPGLQPKQALRMWLASPPHRRNLLDPRWREVGISAIRANSAPGVFGGHDVVVLTAAFGVRR